MTSNRQIDLAWRYHDQTKHSYSSIRTSPHYLDWSNQPAPFKIYPSIDPIALPVEFALTGVRALDAVASPGRRGLRCRQANPRHSLQACSFTRPASPKRRSIQAVRFTFGRRRARARFIRPRSTSCVARSMGLRRESTTSTRVTFLATVARGRSSWCVDSRNWVGTLGGSAPVVLVYSAISFEAPGSTATARIVIIIWDNGMILANALAMAAAHKLPAEVVLGFVESEVNRLIGIDGGGELALSLLTLGHSKEAPPASRSSDDLRLLNPEVIPVSPAPVDYASIREMHDASSLADENEGGSWRMKAFATPASGKEFFHSEAKLTPLSPLGDELAEASIEAVIERRGSTRRFARKPISFAHLSTMLDRSTRGMPIDCLDQGEQINDLYLLVNRVEGLEPGAYFYRQAERALELLKPGVFQRPGNIPDARATPWRGRQRNDILHGDLTAGLRALWQSGLSRGAVGSGDHRRKDLPGGLRDRARRDRAHLFR